VQERKPARLEEGAEVSVPSGRILGGLWRGEMSGTIKVNIVGSAVPIFGRRSWEMDARQGMTLRDLLTRLSLDAGPDYTEKVYDRETGRMNEHISVFVNSRESRSLRGPDTPLEPGDTVTIMPPMAGGCENAGTRGVAEKVDAPDDRRFKS
jgi:molybdopterin synthase sulfur carrier subunit